MMTDYNFNSSLVPTKNPYMPILPAPPPLYLALHFTDIQIIPKILQPFT